MMRLLLVASLVSVTVAVNTVAFQSAAKGSSYDDFRLRHGHRHSSDAVSYETRRDLYNMRLARIASHNSLRRSWRVGVNKFADYTDKELHAMLGYKRGARSLHGPPTHSSFLQMAAGGAQIGSPKRLKDEVDWRTHLSSAKFFRDQGACGSCWAVASVGALEMQAELSKGNTTQLSYQQLVDCVANPQHCGGTGGCQGATAELAFEYVQTYGLTREGHYSSCPKARTNGAAITSWARLPTNEGHPLMRAVAEHGPVVVSVDGTSWFNYLNGVFAGCEKDAVVNHAVLTLGYGKDNSGDDEQPYWLIRNSWGATWGEEGHIRILRHDDDKAFCGIDNDPKQGVGCDGGPEKIPVCGMCGILSDSSHPLGASA